MARNAALRAAADLEVLVFIDDDETPEPEWLSVMLGAHARLGGAADHGTGPAHARARARALGQSGAGDGPPPLPHRHRRWRRPARATCSSTSRTSVATGITFDDELGIAGGSDHLFTKQLRRTGGAIYWCDEAVVHELVPADRLTGRWTLRRGYRSGSATVRVDLMLADTIRRTSAGARPGAGRRPRSGRLRQRAGRRGPRDGQRGPQGPWRLDGRQGSRARRWFRGARVLGVPPARPWWGAAAAAVEHRHGSAR